MSTILLGTVAIEPARWSIHDPNAESTPIVLSEWLDAIAAAGFDGVEIWEPHLDRAGPDEARAVLAHGLPLTVYNSYVSLDDADPARRRAVAGWVERTRSTGVKFNVGNSADTRDTYAERIAEWLPMLPAGTVLLCECHHGISIAEDPLVAAAIFERAGPVDRVQAIVHTHEEPDHIRARFGAYGDRITHVHVNFLDFTTMGAPPLADIIDRVDDQAELLRSLGFDGTWTLEFVHGLLTDDDHPGALLDQAAADLAVLREVLGP